MTTDIPSHILSRYQELSLNVPRVAESICAGLKLFEPVLFVNRDNARIYPSARIDSFVKLECGLGLVIGDLVHIASFVHILGGGICILESGSSCGSGVKIITGSNKPGKGHGCSAIDPNGVVVRSFVHVKRNAVLYTGSIISPGVTIGEEAVILPGAVITRNIPDGETWGGVPARRLKPAATLQSTEELYVAEQKSDTIRRESLDSHGMFIEAQAEWFGWSTDNRGSL